MTGAAVAGGGRVRAGRALGCVGAVFASLLNDYRAELY